MTKEKDKDNKILIKLEDFIGATFNMFRDDDIIII